MIAGISTLQLHNISHKLLFAASAGSSCCQRTPALIRCCGGVLSRMKFWRSSYISKLCPQSCSINAQCRISIQSGVNNCQNHQRNKAQTIVMRVAVLVRRAHAKADHRNRSKLKVCVTCGISSTWLAHRTTQTRHWIFRWMALRWIMYFDRSLISIIA